VDILIDSNILVSAGAFPNKRILDFLTAISEQHNLFLCTYSLEEVVGVFKRKFPHRINGFEALLRSLRYTIVHTPTAEVIPDILGGVAVRDKKDNPILASAIFADVDVLITGDRDFEGIDIERPEILTIGVFTEKYIR
jgi:predicted nucleic acid-binding protein